jgi:hypothetical protein
MLMTPRVVETEGLGLDFLDLVAEGMVVVIELPMGEKANVKVLQLFLSTLSFTLLLFLLPLIT